MAYSDLVKDKGDQADRFRCPACNPPTAKRHVSSWACRQERGCLDSGWATGGKPNANPLPFPAGVDVHMHYRCELCGHEWATK